MRRNRARVRKTAEANGLLEPRNDSEGQHQKATGNRQKANLVAEETKVLNKSVLLRELHERVTGKHGPSPFCGLVGAINVIELDNLDVVKGTAPT